MLESAVGLVVEVRASRRRVVLLSRATLLRLRREEYFSLLLLAPTPGRRAEFCGDADNRVFSINTFEYLAVPEPATILLLGLGGLELLRRRRNL